MKVAARTLFRAGQTTLVTDLTWPSYQRILHRAARQWSGRIKRLPIRAEILSGNLSVIEVVNLIARRVQRTACRGLLLPAVSHDGIRLPIAEICREMRRFCPNVFVAIDGSQAMGQVPINLTDVPCDMFFGGCHKWLGAYLPLGVAFFTCRASAPASRWECHADPLSSFLSGLESEGPPRFTETINVSPLFSCRGAMEDFALGEAQANTLQRRRARAEMMVRIGQLAGWTPLLPDDSFRSAAILLQSTSSAIRQLNPHELRDRFHKLGVALTCYRGGIIRLSAPSKPLSTHEVGALIQALVLVQARATRSIPQPDQVLYAEATAQMA
jgi:selenocysteine lyase/cysteine desulfurase